MYFGAEKIVELPVLSSRKELHHRYYLLGFTILKSISTFYANNPPMLLRQKQHLGFTRLLDVQKHSNRRVAA
jgi:hypothetical protein